MAYYAPPDATGLRQDLLDWIGTSATTAWGTAPPRAWVRAIESGGAFLFDENLLIRDGWSSYPPYGSNKPNIAYIVEANTDRARMATQAESDDESIPASWDAWDRVETNQTKRGHPTWARI